MSGQFDDDTVGYGKPPRWSQFEKGKSGNPKGRPRKERGSAAMASSMSTLDDIIRAELGKSVTVREGGKAVRLTKLELAIKAQLATAAKGNAVAQREVVKLAQELAMRDSQRAWDEQERKLRIFESIRSWRDVRVKEWAEASTRGCEPDEIWPHPDDILINEAEHAWDVRGPTSAEDVPRFEYYRAERDWNFASGVIKARLAKTDAERRYGLALHMFWIMYDRMLPTRWRIEKRHFDLIETFFLMREDKLQDRIDRADRERIRLRPSQSSEDQRYAYREANRLMKPLLKRCGYRSIAELERACEQNDTQPPLTLELAVKPDGTWPHQNRAR